MSDDAIRERAQERGRATGGAYAGALLPAEAHDLMEANPSARLVDVRSRAEWEFVGRIPGAIEIEWKAWPGMRPNPDFLSALEAQVPKDAPVLFLCRSGGRSHDAALAAQQAGYDEAYNVLEGFEGDKDDRQHRNSVGGWRAAGLPWLQG